jgi:predicted metalloprotease with PDZ domain
LRLLELSGGKRGLRDVLLELAKKYGPNKPISEKNFFQDFTQMTYPEIGDFFQRYIKNAEPLPLQEYYSKIGIRYQRAMPTGKQIATLGAIGLESRETSVYFTKVGGPLQTAGIQVGDKLVAIDGARTNIAPVLRQLPTRAPGTVVSFIISRNGQEQTVPVKLASTEEIKRYVFTQDPAATPAQLALRQAWLKNL